MQEPLISVIIPAFNRVKNLPDLRLLKTVNSVLNQTHRNLELIVVDDCSATPAVLSLSSVVDARVRIIRHDQNQDVSAARNTGVAHASGQMIAFLDHDDLWEPEKLEHQLSFMEKFNHTASVTDFLPLENDRRYDRKNSDKNPDWLVVTGCAMVLSSMLVHKKVFEHVGPFDTRMPSMQDWDWFLRYHEKGYKMAIVPEPLTIYTGAHSRGSIIEMLDLQRIKQKHCVVLLDNSSDHDAFDAAIMWKAARIQFSQRHYISAASDLILSALRSPINLVKYCAVVLREPIRHMVSLRHSAHSVRNNNI